MIRLGLIALGLLYLALPVLAQTVQVRSGEHAEFSRLTLTLPERVAWTIADSAEGAHVSFGSDDLVIDPGQIFDRIPRTRLSDARWNAADRRLELSFGCACEVRGFWFGEAMLVLDITEGVADPPGGSAGVMDGAVPMPSASTAATLLTPFPDLPDPGASDPAGGPLQAGEGAAIEEARSSLLRQISRATSQGLLAPQQRLPELPATPSVPIEDTGAAVPDAPPGDPPSPRANLRVMSRVDLDYLGIRTASERAAAEIGCLSDDLLDISGWGTDAPFGSQIAERRRHLTGELDEVDHEAVEALARLYLHFGFGAEARDVLRLLPGEGMPGQNGAIDLLVALAGIAERGFAPPGSPLAGQLDCDSVAAFWSALSYASLPENAVMDTDAILRGFNALPPHLRRYYGPILSRRFLDAERPDIASRLLRIMDRAGQTFSGEGEMAKAQTELAEGATETATLRLERVVDSNVESSAEALIAMIDTRAGLGEPVSPDKAALAGAFAFEKRNEPLAGELHAAHIRALAGSGDFDAAGDVYVESREQIDTALQPALRSDVLRYLVREADDVTFLRHALSHAFDHVHQSDPIVAHAFAARMLELGFPEAAGEVIATDLPGNSELFRERRLLRGEVALALDRPRQALVELLDLTGARANLLRARALDAAGEHTAAMVLFGSSGAEADARETALRAGLWRGAVTADASPDDTGLDRQATATGALAENPPELSTLASRRALIGQSSATRDAVSELLATYPQPDLTAN